MATQQRVARLERSRSGIRGRPGLLARMIGRFRGADAGARRSVLYSADVHTAQLTWWRAY